MAKLSCLDTGFEKSGIEAGVGNILIGVLVNIWELLEWENILMLELFWFEGIKLDDKCKLVFGWIVFLLISEEVLLFWFKLNSGWWFMIFAL